MPWELSTGEPDYVIKEGPSDVGLQFSHTAQLHGFRTPDTLVFTVEKFGDSKISGYIYIQVIALAPLLDDGDDVPRRWQFIAQIKRKTNVPYTTMRCEGWFDLHFRIGELFFIN